MIDDEAPVTVSDFPMAPNDLRVAMTAFGEGLMRSMRICFPCCVYSFDRTTHKAIVMPLVKQAFYNGEWVYLRRMTFETTVRNIQAGGFTIDFPLYIGDTGWVFASDRDTMLLKREGGLTNSVLEGNREISLIEDSYQQKPNTPIINSQSHGFFLPDNWGKWETHRFKDSPGVAIGDALYIGSSIDTEDEDDAGGQKGDGYEQKMTSSFVLQKGGGAYVLSSTKTKPKDAKGRSRTSKVSVVGDTVEIAVSDMTEDTPIDASITIGTESGIVIRQDNPKDNLNFIASVQEDQFTMRLMDIENKKTVSMTFENGQLDVHTTDAVNIFSQKDVNIKGAEHAYVTANDARVVASDTASVAAKTVSASAEATINIAAGKKINLTAPNNVNIITASNVTILAKKKEANISIATMSKDATIEVRSEGENATIGLMTEAKGAAIDVSTSGEESDISVKAESANVNVMAKDRAKVSAESIILDGEVMITGGCAIEGETSIQGKQLKAGRVGHPGGNAWTY